MKPVILDFSNHKAASNLFNEAFQHPRRKYVVHPVDKEVAAEWLKENTYMTNFTWCAGAKSFEKRLAEAGSLRCGELIHLDTLYYRDRCGWQAGNWHCDYPYEKEDAEECEEDDCEECEELGKDEQGEQLHKRLCFSFNCPIAYEADRDDIKKLDPGLYKSDYKPYPDETPQDWMVLHSRPRYAYVPNVRVVGCEDVRRY
jgi:hypothetical protein